jgi:nitrite reductase/ring-hydroxylating ferredoxin subunit
MKPSMLDYTREEISQLTDDALEAEWRDYMAFSTQRQRLREEVQRMMRKKSAAGRFKSAGIPEGGMIATREGDREILLARVEGKVYAIDNACGHSGYPLDKGRLDGHVVTCRWHDAKFDVRTGQVLAPGADIKPLRRYRVGDAGNGTVTLGEEL